MEPPLPIAKTFEPHGDMQRFRLEGLTEFTCVQCGKTKMSKLVVVQNQDWTSRICNGCYGELLAKQ